MFEFKEALENHAYSTGHIGAVTWNKDYPQLEPEAMKKEQNATYCNVCVKEIGPERYDHHLIDWANTNSLLGNKTNLISFF